MLTRLECLDSLLPSAPNLRQNTVSIPEQRTGSWVFDEPQFRDWLKAEGKSTLLLCGKPGSGKSTLIRKVMREFQQKLNTPDLTVMLGGKDIAGRMDLEKHLNVKIDKKNIVASFFYNSREQHRKLETSHVHMLQSLLYQLLKQEEELFPIYRKTYIELRDLYTRNVDQYKRHHVRFDWPFESLLFILRNILIHRSRPCALYIFVDAMDESNTEGRWDVLSLLTQTQAIEAKIMIASRPLPRNFKVDYKIVLEDHNSNDIVRLVNSKVDFYMELTPPNEIANYDFEAFQEQVICRADGVILWVSLVLSVTQSLFEDGPPPPDDMIQILNSLPDDLENLYIAIVDRLKSIPANIKRGKQWLKWAAFSARLLNLNEFREAVAVSELDSQYDGTPEMLGPKQFGPSFKTAESNLRRICGGFVELKSLRFPNLLQYIQSEQLASSTAIQLLHQTVKQFLEKQKATPFQSLKPQGDLLIARSCSRYLLSLSERSFLSPVGIKQATVWELKDYECLVRHLEKRPLLNYVFTFLPYHLQCLELQHELNALGHIIEEIWTNPPARYLIASWANQMLTDCDQGPGQQRITILDPNQWLQFWSQQPSIHLSEHEKIFVPKFITRAIVAAVKARLFAAVKALVAVGAAVDISDDLNASSALDAAAAEGHLDIYSYLSQYATTASAILESTSTYSSSDRQPPSGRFGNFPTRTEPSANIALRTAAVEGNLSQLRWVLDAGAQPDSRDDHGLSAVHWAALHGNDKIVKLLVEAGADVNSKADQGKTPLMLAAENGHINAARMLLESGADPALKSKNGTTPYSLALLHNHKAIIQLLSEVQMVGGPTDAEPMSIFMVPFSRNKNFVGRESIFVQITQLLQARDHRPVVLTGFGGIGYDINRLFFVKRETIV
jgi:Ankyrin repeats (3 copies)